MNSQGAADAAAALRAHRPPLRPCVRRLRQRTSAAAVPRRRPRSPPVLSHIYRLPSRDWFPRWVYTASPPAIGSHVG
eukprot:4303911-Pyramimonas_sp.AAC.1